MADKSLPSEGSHDKVRTAFPQVCKWFEQENTVLSPDQAASEVNDRFLRFKDIGTSPCDGCPLCQGHH